MSGYRRAGYPSPPSNPPHTILLLTVVAIFLVVPSFIAEQTSLEVLTEVNPLMVMVAPLFLVLAIRWLSSVGKRGGGGGIPVGTPHSVSRTSGGSPVGVAIVLLIVLLMVWYQSSGEEETFE
ncbi:hypothetical protein SUGI_1038210 [Cryptomeria japonica]|uniref:uncharacterized protein LOC131075849 n=1 Tax=Cryptomeria japonica TaxID=3369 RepID=UPI002414B974|nr:uncharacterized protein LOC131075849 [Cryptomeria japonica]GLJ49197.1 hypothetical protein SUGI_1038210 [Cryptomeria japonica]